eukprot:3519192-Amphidinium_carterae.1
MASILRHIVYRTTQVCSSSVRLWLKSWPCYLTRSEAPPLLIGGDSAGAGLAYSVLLSLNSGHRCAVDVSPYASRREGIYCRSFFLFAVDKHEVIRSYSGYAHKFCPCIYSACIRCDTPSYLHNAFSRITRAKGGVGYSGDVLNQDIVCMHASAQAARRHHRLSTGHNHLLHFSAYPVAQTCVCVCVCVELDSSKLLMYL